MNTKRSSHQRVRSSRPVGTPQRKKRQRRKQKNRRKLKMPLLRKWKQTPINQNSKSKSRNRQSKEQLKKRSHNQSNLKRKLTRESALTTEVKQIGTSGPSQLEMLMSRFHCLRARLPAKCLLKSSRSTWRSLLKVKQYRLLTANCARKWRWKIVSGPLRTPSSWILTLRRLVKRSGKLLSWAMLRLTHKK